MLVKKVLINSQMKNEIYSKYCYYPKQFHFSKYFTYSQYSAIHKGNNDDDNKIYLEIDGKIKSFWHDIPLTNKDSTYNTYNTYNMVIEIPCKSKLNLAMNLNEDNNPIILKSNKKPLNTTNNTRDYSKDPEMNYGFFPRTYSDKNKKYLNNEYNGDGDPVDVIEIGGPYNKKAGDILVVKLLGSFCLIDQGELDWKIVVVNIENLPSNISQDNTHSNSDALSLITNKSKEIKELMHWFKIYKTFYGKSENIILNNKFYSIDETIKTINELHTDYKNYLNKTKNIL